MRQPRPQPGCCATEENKKDYSTTNLGTGILLDYLLTRQNYRHTQTYEQDTF
jgi:hypothetical protein